MADKKDDFSKLVLDEQEELVDKFNKSIAKLEAERKKLKDAEKAGTQTEADIRRLAAVERQLKKETAEQSKQDYLNNLKEQAEYAETLEERQSAQRKLQAEELATSIADNITSSLSSGISKLYSEMTAAADTYASYVDRIAVHLVGANDTFESISDNLTKVFGASPIFQMSEVMENAAKLVEMGVNYNIEARATMATLAEKVAATFDAFSDSLLRIIRIQQEDSTTARLGMESLLTEFLNSNFQDSSYLTSNINETVTSALLEAISLYDAETSTQFEYVVQQWLGSLYSLGVSSDLVTTLAEGIGYIASGDISALSSNDTLQTLLVAAANRGGADYGSMLINGMTVDDVNSIMEGLLSIATEISELDSNAALSAYAEAFGMTVSDISALMNVTSDVVSEITGTTTSYSDFIQRVSDETTLSKLLSRTSYAELGDNLYQNFLYSAGSGIASNLGTYVMWQLSDVVSSALNSIDFGVSVTPFGVGTSTSVNIGDMVQAVAVLAGSMSGISGMLSGIGSISGVDLSALTTESASVTRGTLTSMATEGTSTSTTSYSGDFSESALQSTANATIADVEATYEDEEYDEATEKVSQMADSLSEVGDDLKFIVQLLNESGIVIRGRVGTVSAATPIFDSITSSDDISVIVGSSTVS